MTTTKIPAEFLEAITGSEITDGGIGTADIADSGVTTAKIANNAITAAKLPDNVITATHIPNGLITGTHIAGTTITATQIANNAVGTDQLAGIARGKILYGDSNGDPQLLTIGSNGTALVSDGTDISWGTISSYADSDVESYLDSNGTTFPDSVKAQFGAGNDLQLYHDATDSYITNATGDLYIRNNTDDKDIVLQSDDGSGGVAQYIRLDGSAGLTQFDRDTKHVDNKKATFGNGGDLEILHDGSNNYIKSVAAGWLNIPITGNGVTIANSDFSENLFKAVNNGAVELYYNGVKKIETTSAGATITGTLGVTGTTTLSGDLNIFGANRLINIGESGSGGTFGFLGWNDASNYLYLGNSYNSAYNTNIVIDSSGKVGIGTSDPSAILEVVDSSASAPGTALKVYSAQNSAASDGLVFIHSDQELAPFTALNVRQDGTGDILNLLTDTTEVFTVTAAGTFGMGSGSGSLAGSIIINNDGNTGTIDNAYYNTVLGWEAADDLTTGDSNTIIGNQAGYKLTSGIYNTLVGRLAGEKLTTGSANIAIGYDSMGGGVVTGNYNIAIGHETLLALTSGAENICMGRDSGHDIQHAVQNVAIGHESMTKNVGGTGNVCVGFQAGENSTGGANTMIGYKAGESNEGGVFNVFIGEAVGGSHPSHSQAVGIGRDITAAPGQVSIGTSGYGKITSPFSSSVSWSGGSDVRLKQNITDSTLGLNFINSLRTVNFKWKPNNELPEAFSSYQEENVKDVETIQTGLIAQEVKTVIDGLGGETFNGWSVDDEGIQQIAPAGFVYPLIKAVQELKTKLEAAEARIATLEG